MNFYFPPKKTFITTRLRIAHSLTAAPLQMIKGQRRTTRLHTAKALEPILHVGALQQCFHVSVPLQVEITFRAARGLPLESVRLRGNRLLRFLQSSGGKNESFREEADEVLFIGGKVKHKSTPVSVRVQRKLAKHDITFLAWSYLHHGHQKQSLLISYRP